MMKKGFKEIGTTAAVATAVMALGTFANQEKVLGDVVSSQNVPASTNQMTIAEAEANVNSAQAAVNSAQEEAYATSQSVIIANSEIEKAKGTVSFYEQEVSSANAALQDAQRRLTDSDAGKAAADIEAKQQAYDAAQTAVASAQNETNRVKSDLEYNEYYLPNREQDVTSARESVETAQKYVNNEGLEDAQAEFKAAENEWRNALEILQPLREKLKNALRSGTQQEIDEAAKLFDEANDKYSPIHERMNRAEADLYGYQQDPAKKASNLEDAKQSLINAEEKLALLKNNLAKDQQDLEKLAGIVASKSSEAQKYQNELNDAHQKWDADIKKLNDDMQYAKLVLDNSKQGLEQAQLSYQNSLQYLSYITEQDKQAREVLATSQSELKKAQNTLEILKAIQNTTGDQGNKDQDQPAKPDQGNKDQDQPVTPDQGNKDQDQPAKPDQGNKDQDQPVTPDQGSKDQDQPATSAQGNKDQGQPLTSDQGKKVAASSRISNLNLYPAKAETKLPQTGAANREAELMGVVGMAMLTLLTGKLFTKKRMRF